MRSGRVGDRADRDYRLFGVRAKAGSACHSGHEHDPWRDRGDPSLFKSLAALGCSEGFFAYFGTNEAGSAHFPQPLDQR